MIRVTVLFFGGLKDALGCSREDIELPSDTAHSLTRLYEVLTKRHPRLPSMMASVRLAQNEEFLPGLGEAAFERGGALESGDVVALIPPVTGG